MALSLLLSLVSLGASLSPVHSVALILPTPENAVVGQIAAVASRQLRSRSDAEIVFDREADFMLALAVDPALEPEQFSISDMGEEGVRITGGKERAILYGLGKFLRTSRYSRDGFIPGDWRGTSAPEGTFRAVYAATHFQNFYEAAPPDEVSRYLEDLALWGANAVIVHFPTWSFAGFDDPAARRNLDQTRRLLRAAKAIGLETGIIQCPNQGFTTAPPETRAEPNPDEMKRRGNTGVNCCPSSPEGNAYLQDLYAKLFAEYRDVGLDHLICWPYDEGGCGCGRCAPWGATAFPALSKAVADLGRGVFPDLNVILSTWLYDLPPAGEWEGLAAFAKNNPAWLNGIMCDDHLDFPRYPLDVGVPAGLPLYNFPEISMWGRYPWGAFGANPLPTRFEGLWKQTDGRLSGGMPYSEGIFEDMNKAVCFQFYWNKNTTAEDTLREYVTFEFAPEVVDDVLKAVCLLEEAWLERGPKSKEAFGILENVNAQLPAWARQGWRWRILYLRGLIDSQMAENGNKLEGTVLRDAFSELTRIYHAENAHPTLKPPVIP